MWTRWFGRVAPRLSTTSDLDENPVIQSILQEYHRHHNAAGSTSSTTSNQSPPPWAITMQVVDQLTPEEKKIHKSGFLPGPDFRWLATGTLGKDETEQTDKDNDAHHVKVTEYMIECVLRFTELYGSCIVCRHATTNEYLGSIHLIPPYQAKYGWLYKMHFLRSVIPLGQPVPLVLSSSSPSSLSGTTMAQRFDSYTSRTEQEHDLVTDHRRQPHWHVANLGVASAAQGKGIGRLLMKTAVALAQTPTADDTTTSSSSSVRLYLECHNDNVAFYQKCGLHHAKRYVIYATPTTKTDKDNQQSKPEPVSPVLYYNAMVLQQDPTTTDTGRQ